VLSHSELSCLKLSCSLESVNSDCCRFKLDVAFNNLWLLPAVGEESKEVLGLGAEAKRLLLIEDVAAVFGKLRDAIWVRHDAGSGGVCNCGTKMRKLAAENALFEDQSGCAVGERS
jgi:hypothetical protein